MSEEEDGVEQHAGAEEDDQDDTQNAESPIDPDFEDDPPDPHHQNGGDTDEDEPPDVEEDPVEPEEDESADSNPLDDDDFEDDFAPEDADTPAASQPISSPLITEVMRAIRPPGAPRRSCRNLVGRYDTGNYSSEKLHRLFDKMMQTKKCPELTSLSPLRHWVAREMLTAVDSRKYDYGAYLKEGDSMLERFMKRDQLAYLQDKRRTDAAIRCGTVKQRLKGISRDWQTEIEILVESRDLRTAELKRAHNREIAAFEKHWADPTHLLGFKKPSPKLILLRTTERRLAILKQFDRAKRIKWEADKLEREEALEAQKKAIAAMKLEFENMEGRHERELFGLQGFADRTREELEKHRDSVIEPLQRLITRLTGIVEKPVLPERKKEGVFLEQVWPESPRPVKNTQSARNMGQGRALSLSGIKLRQYITARKKKKSSPAL